MYFEDKNNVEAPGKRNGDDVFSKPVRAGKRTYFFDVKATKGNDYYLTITESKRRIEKDGRFVYDKHKIFLYKEDFDKFADGLEEVVSFIRENCTVPDRTAPRHQTAPISETPDKISEVNELKTEPIIDKKPNSFSDVKFEEL
ncbi:MAG: DUF3276 family protein [Bacteroidales bacterium]